MTTSGPADAAARTATQAPVQAQVQVQVRYFASLREALGAGESIELQAGDDATLGALRDRLAARGGRHAEALARPRALRCALNQTMADESTPIVAAPGAGDRAEVAFFPPVTGG